MQELLGRHPLAKPCRLHSFQLYSCDYSVWRHLPIKTAWIASAAIEQAPSTMHHPLEALHVTIDRTRHRRFVKLGVSMVSDHYSTNFSHAPSEIQRGSSFERENKKRENWQKTTPHRQSRKSNVNPEQSHETTIFSTFKFLRGINDAARALGGQMLTCGERSEVARCSWG